MKRVIDKELMEAVIQDLRKVLAQHDLKYYEDISLVLENLDSQIEKEARLNSEKIDTDVDEEEMYR